MGQFLTRITAVLQSAMTDCIHKNIRMVNVRVMAEAAEAAEVAV
jgi:hypothetical protein